MTFDSFDFHAYRARRVRATALRRAKSRVTNKDWRTYELYLEGDFEAAMDGTGRDRRAVYQALYRVKKVLREELQRWEELNDL